ncbi:MAG: glycosyltransferase [Proteobacteria bacterium]|nr:glycosyltransferase [Pseudomonadota bacterium]
MSESKSPGDSLIGVILAAGRGIRAYPTTKQIPAPLMAVGGKPLIERNIEVLRDQLHIKDVIIVIGLLGEQIVDYFKDKQVGVNISYIEQNEPKGTGHALLQTENQLVGRRFLVILGDELYVGSDHTKLLEYQDSDFAGVLTFMKEKNPKKVSRNFVGTFENDRVLSLIEKPQQPKTELMGLGTYLLTDKVFQYLRAVEKPKPGGRIELTEALSDMSGSEKVMYCTLDVSYLNVTTKEDCNFANYLLRDLNFDRYSISVVIPAYNEAETITEVIEDYLSHPRVDEVLVVDNNSKDNTFDLAVKAGARVVKENRQGYGCALRRGIEESQGDIAVLTEGDGSFRAKDVSKLLEYLKDCDMAIGTRTTRQMIEQGANMDFFTRWANVAFGKLIELLWWGQEPRFTDVGCTYRAVWKNSYNDIVPFVDSKGPEFSTEMMIAMLISRKRIIEIPVTYYRRLGGESKHSISYYGKMKTALRMLGVTMKRRFNVWNG